MTTRRKEVEHILSEFDAYEPAYSDLIVLGREVGAESQEAQLTPRSTIPSEQNEPEEAVNTPTDLVPGPGISVNGKTMVFGENSQIKTEIYFDRFRGQMEVTHLRMSNVGATTG